MKFLGCKIVVSEGLLDDRVMMTSIDHGSPGGDETAVVVAALQSDGRWRVDHMLSRREAEEAFGRAMIGLKPVKA